MGGRGSNSGFNSAISAALGHKGKPVSMDDAMARVNPHYKEGKKWQENCQRCVFAYEMARRGYDVEALPRLYDGTDKLPYMYSSEGWPKVMEGAKLVDFPSHNTVKHMLDQMADWGDGARAVVRVLWKGGHSGHVFIAEQKGNGTIFLDPQSGHYVDIDKYMGAAIKGKTKLMRVDDLKPSQLITKCVQKRQK